MKGVVHLVHALSACIAQCLRHGDDNDKEVTFKAMRGLRGALRGGREGVGVCVCVGGERERERERFLARLQALR